MIGKVSISHFVDHLFFHFPEKYKFHQFLRVPKTLWDYAIVNSWLVEITN